MLIVSQPLPNQSVYLSVKRLIISKRIPPGSLIPSSSLFLQDQLMVCKNHDLSLLFSETNQGDCFPRGLSPRQLLFKQPLHFLIHLTMYFYIKFPDIQQNQITFRREINMAIDAQEIFPWYSVLIIFNKIRSLLAIFTIRGSQLASYMKNIPCCSENFVNP